MHESIILGNTHTHIHTHTHIVTRTPTHAYHISSTGGYLLVPFMHMNMSSEWGSILMPSAPFVAGQPPTYWCYSPTYVDHAHVDKNSLWWYNNALDNEYNEVYLWLYQYINIVVTNELFLRMHTWTKNNLWWYNTSSILDLLPVATNLTPKGLRMSPLRDYGCHP